MWIDIVGFFACWAVGIITGWTVRSIKAEREETADE